MSPRAWIRGAVYLTLCLTLVIIVAGCSIKAGKPCALSLERASGRPKEAIETARLFATARKLQRLGAVGAMFRKGFLGERRQYVLRFFERRGPSPLRGKLIQKDGSKRILFCGK